MAYRTSAPRAMFNESSLVKALSAVIGSFISNSIFYPLNVARLKLQCDPEIMSKSSSFLKVLYDMVKEQGFISLYQGWAANSTSLCIGSFIYFYLNNAFKLLYQRRRGGMDKQDLSYAAHIVVASASGVVNILITTPLWVATTRLMMQDKRRKIKHFSTAIITNNDAKTNIYTSINPQIPSLSPETNDKLLLENVVAKQRKKRTINNKNSAIRGTANRYQDYKDLKKTYNGLFHCLYETYNEGGMQSLWAGLVPSLFLVSNPAIQTVTYEKLLLWYEGIISRTCAPFEFFILAAIGKALATVLTYPLQVAQSQQQNNAGNINADKSNAGNGHVSTAQAPSLITILFNVYSKKGVSGLFSGIYAKLWQTVLNSAFMYMTYETVQRFITMVLISQRRRRRVPFNIKYKRAK
jgi:hypothetical protein